MGRRLIFESCVRNFALMLNRKFENTAFGAIELGCFFCVIYWVDPPIRFFIMIYFIVDLDLACVCDANALFSELK